MMRLTEGTVLVQDGEPRASQLDQEVVLLSLRAGVIFGLNRAATEIWNLLGEPRPVGEICEALSQRYEVDAATLSGDVIPFLETLVRRNLLRVVGARERR